MELACGNDRRGTIKTSGKSFAVVEVLKEKVDSDKEDVDIKNVKKISFFVLKNGSKATALQEKTRMSTGDKNSLYNR